MYQGNWKCSSCGGAITELPFEPRSEKGLTCRACFMKQRDGGVPAPAAPEMSSSDEPPDIPFDAEVASEPPPPPEFEGATDAPAEKPKFEGSWPCSVCGKEITSLPFEPRNTSGLKCLDCFKQSKA